MPKDWQKRFVRLLEELEAHEEFHCPKEGTYQVYLRGENGRFIEDFFRDYERGRRNLLTDK
jgi:nucleoid-associated protein YejK